MEKYELLRKYVCLLGEIYKKPIVVKELYFVLHEYFEVRFGEGESSTTRVKRFNYDVSNFALLDTLGIIKISSIEKGYLLKIYDDSFGKLMYNIERGNIQR